jgi:hypothetical protein
MLNPFVYVYCFVFMIVSGTWRKLSRAAKVAARPAARR